MNTINQTIQHDEQGDLDALFLGRKVVGMEQVEDTLAILLDNGTKATVVPSAGQFDGDNCDTEFYEVSKFFHGEHVITGVSVQRDDTSDHTSYRLQFFGAGALIGGEVTMVGNDGNGYYGTGFSVDISI